MSYEEVVEQVSFPPLAERTLGEIAAMLPGATGVFRRYKLDFCCGGSVSLADAAERKGLSSAQISSELQALGRDDAAELPEETPALIDHILTHFHDVHSKELPELVRLARRVEAVHRDHPEVPAGLADALELMRRELEDHMQKEELVLFPMMKEGGSPLIGMPIQRMRLEHDEHGERLRAVEELCRGGIAPPGACTTWRALYTGVRKLVDDLMEHIHLENNVLFPRYATLRPQ